MNKVQCKDKCIKLRDGIRKRDNPDGSRKIPVTNAEQRCGVPRRNYVYASGTRSKPCIADISEIFRAVAKINGSRPVRMNSQDVRLKIIFPRREITSEKNYFELKMICKKVTSIIRILCREIIRLE